MDDDQSTMLSTAATVAGSSMGMPWIGPVVGGLLGMFGQEDTNEANSAQSQRQMDFQREMSNTSYQRAVKDMEAAGLNPMLAYSQGGASSPGGSSAIMGNKVAAGVSSAAAVDQAQQVRAQTDNVRADSELKYSQADVNRAQLPELEARTKMGLSSAGHLDEMIKELKQFVERGGGLARANNLWADYLPRRDRYDRGGVDQDWRGRESEIRLHQARSLLEELESDRGRAYSGMWKDLGKAGAYAEAGAGVLGRVAGSAGAIGLRLPQKHNELILRGANGSISRSGRSGSW